jgi:hypothetical protein
VAKKVLVMNVPKDYEEDHYFRIKPGRGDHAEGAVGPPTAENHMTVFSEGEVFASRRPLDKLHHDKFEDVTEEVRAQEAGKPTKKAKIKISKPEDADAPPPAGEEAPEPDDETGEEEKVEKKPEKKEKGPNGEIDVTDQFGDKAKKADVIVFKLNRLYSIVDADQWDKVLASDLKNKDEVNAAIQKVIDEA